ncbi:calmodulin-like protein 5 [Lineus longissimus]|uniref:calmodulin-like protein 5 n=1 Tax=Lineus longissimus TaxID=88925 RepID=UPI002B4EB8B6
MAGCVTLSDEDQQKIKCYRDVFNQFDTDGSGWLDRNEIARLLAMKPSDPDKPTPSADQVFALADENSDNRISKEEFLSALAGVTKQDQYAYMFRSFDLDHDGKITAHELLKAMKQKETKETLQSAKKLIAQLDVNGDGKLDPEEFAKKIGHMFAGK